jgi:hypothetical protein
MYIFFFTFAIIHRRSSWVVFFLNRFRLLSEETGINHIKLGMSYGVGYDHLTMK